MTGWLGGQSLADRSAGLDRGETEDVGALG